MDNISFTSRYRFVGKGEFARTTMSFSKQQFVDFPWTIKEAVLSNKAYTKDVEDCTVLGLTDGLKVLLLHLTPSLSQNRKFNKIVEFINEKIDVKNPYLQGFIMGSKPNMINSPDSEKVYNFLEKFLNENKIPYTKMKGSRCAHDVAYNSTTDEWTICCENFIEKNKITTDEFLKSNFNTVEFCAEDEFI